MAVDVIFSFDSEDFETPAAMALLNVPVFCDAPVEWAPGRPMWFCGALCIKYHTSFDRYFDTPGWQQRLRQDFQGLLAQRRDGGVLVIYTHPCRLITAAPTVTFRFGITRKIQEAPGRTMAYADPRAQACGPPRADQGILTGAD